MQGVQRHVERPHHPDICEDDRRDRRDHDRDIARRYALGYWNRRAALEMIVHDQPPQDRPRKALKAFDDVRATSIEIFTFQTPHEPLSFRREAR